MTDELEAMRKIQEQDRERALNPPEIPPAFAAQQGPVPPEPVDNPEDEEEDEDDDDES